MDRKWQPTRRSAKLAITNSYPTSACAKFVLLKTPKELPLKELKELQPSIFVVHGL